MYICLASIIFFISRLLIAVDHHPVPDRSWGLDWRILLSELVTTMHLVPRHRLELVVLDLLEVERLE